MQKPSCESGKSSSSPANWDDTWKKLRAAENPEKNPPKWGCKLLECSKSQSATVKPTNSFLRGRNKSITCRSNFNNRWSWRIHHTQSAILGFAENLSFLRWHKFTVLKAYFWSQKGFWQKKFHLIFISLHPTLLFDVNHVTKNIVLRQCVQCSISSRRRETNLWFFSLVVETCVLQNASIHFPKKSSWLLLLFSISSVLQCVLVALIGSEILFSRDF